MLHSSTKFKMGTGCTLGAGYGGQSQRHEEVTGRETSVEVVRFTQTGNIGGSLLSIPIHLARS